MEYPLTVLGDDRNLYYCNDESFPYYSSVTSLLKPVYIDDKGDIRVAEKFNIMYPYVYVETSRLMDDSEEIANIQIQ